MASCGHMTFIQCLINVDAKKKKKMPRCCIDIDAMLAQCCVSTGNWLILSVIMFFDVIV